MIGNFIGLLIGVSFGSLAVCFIWGVEIAFASYLTTIAIGGTIIVLFS